jgi:mannose-1-phosphate guanylyltransferase
MRKAPLKAFLLAAGLGTRLKPLTDEIPKCLLPVGGKPLMQIWLEHLARQGFDEVLVNTHWHHQKVAAFLKTWQGKPRITPFYEPELLGSAGTILANRHWVPDDAPFFILYADNLTQVDLKKILAFHQEHGLVFTLGVFKSRNPSQCGIAQVHENGLVMEFVEKPEEPKSDLAAAGIYVADARLFTFFPQRDLDSEPGSQAPLDLGFHIFPGLTGRMKAYLIKEFLMDIGTPEQYEQAQLLWRKMEQ